MYWKARKALMRRHVGWKEGGEIERELFCVYEWRLMIKDQTARCALRNASLRVFRHNLTPIKPLPVFTRPGCVLSSGITQEWMTGRGPLISGLPPPGWSSAARRQRWPWEMSRKKRRLETWRWSEKTSSPSAGQFVQGELRGVRGDANGPQLLCF